MNAAHTPHRSSTEDDHLQYRDDEVEANASSGKGKPWKVLIADDDNAVHVMSMAVLRDFEFEGRSVRLLSTQSGEAAKQMLAQQPDIALVLLDVEVESGAAGLDVVRHIRNELRNRAVRIVLRTGQPDQAPEQDAITGFDINDCQAKTELTAQKLITSVVAALRAYRDIVTIEKSRRGLQKAIEASRSLCKRQAVATFAEGVLVQVAAILGRGENCPRMQVSGLVANCDAFRRPLDFRVLAGTGVFAASVGTPLSEAVPATVFARMASPPPGGRCLPQSNEFIGRFLTTNGTENLVYAACDRVLGELDEQLLSVFSANLSVAFDNVYLRDRLREREERYISRALEVERARAAQLAAEASNQAKSEFISRMSHELRTPLNTIMGYAQILMWDLALTKRQRISLDTIHLSGEHLIGLIDEILDLARVEAGKLELHETPIELQPFLAGIANIARVGVTQKGLAFGFESLDLPGTVLADERRLRQVLLNLLNNATRFTDQGQVTLRVRCMSGDGPEAVVRFEVEDSGVGISANDLKTLFRPFCQLGDLERRRGGTGLGLTISRQLVSHMGGEICVQSEPGKGSTFWFELQFPVTKSRAAPANEAIAIGYEGARKTVLIVDDTQENRMVLTHMLEPLGFSTVEAENGKQGLEIALASTPDLILMDSVMPVMDGLETTRRMRESPALSQVPMIALSADATGKAKERALAAGATAVLTKPLRAPQLLDLLEQHLGIRFIQR